MRLFKRRHPHREAASKRRPPRRSKKQHEREIAAGEVPGENEAMKHVWWVGRVTGPGKGRSGHK